MYVFFFSRSSWESVFSKSSEVVTAQELRCCQRVVQLCRDCLLVVYKFVADSRGSLSGLSPDWDDTRYSHFLKRPMITLLKKTTDTHITISTVNTAERHLIWKFNNERKWSDSLHHSTSFKASKTFANSGTKLYRYCIHVTLNLQQL